MKGACVALLVLAAAASGVRAECANACSGHGDCAVKDQCTCYPGWQAADCSERSCPFGLSFVDTPQGDLNADGFLDKPNTKTVILGATSSFWKTSQGMETDGDGTSACDTDGQCSACAAPGCVSLNSKE